MELLHCLDSEANFLNLFDTTIAPTLLYYSYIPILFLVLSFSTFVLIKDKFSLQSRFLFLTSVLFVLFILNELITWISVHANFVMLGWEMSAFFQMAVVISTSFFLYIFTHKKYPSVSFQVLHFGSLVPVLFFLWTKHNIIGFDVVYCEASGYGHLWEYVYIAQIVIFIMALDTLHRRFVYEINWEQKAKILLLGTGTILFLGLFIATNIWGDATRIYEFNLLGPLGMMSFLAFITYMIVRYKAFNIKIIGTQALVAILWFLLFAMLFVRRIENIRYVIIGTLLLFFIIGVNLIRSVKREVEQKEKIERLATRLQIANDHQVNLIHFITHQVKGFFTKSRNIFAALQEADGQIPAEFKAMVNEGFQSDTRAVDTVQQILKAANIRTGSLTYQKENLDFKTLVTGEVDKLQQAADSRGLALALSVAEGDYTLHGDKDQLSHAVRNLIDNSIKYTPQGTVSVSLTKKGAKIILKVIDTGVGISSTDMKRLFTEGGKGEHSTKINVESTGYGLYIVKGIVEAHGGRVWAESEGQGKGSEFIVELPASA